MVHSNLAARTEWTSDSSSRLGVPITQFIVHHAATTSLAATLSLFRPGGRTVSANYAMGSDGTLVATVPEERSPWTTASQTDDRRSVTIEVANSFAGGDWPVSDAAFDKLARLIADVAIRYGFEINDNTVLTHQEIYLRFGRSYATACPGSLQRRKAELLSLANHYKNEATAPVVEEEDEMNADDRARLDNVENMTEAIYNVLVRDGKEPDEWSAGHRIAHTWRNLNEPSHASPKEGEKWSAFHLISWTARTLATVLNEVRALRAEFKAANALKVTAQAAPGEIKK